MRIDSVDLYRVPRPGGGELLYAALHADGRTGWGEVTLEAAPRASAEWGGGALAVTRDWLAPAIVGQSISSGPQLQEALAGFQGQSGAKCALDLAWWQLHAAQQSRPLHQVLGGSSPRVRLAATLDRRESTAEFLASLGALLEAGYDHVLLKLRPGWDLEMLRAVRHAFADAPLAVDGGGQGTLAQQELYFRLEDFFLKYIEQPLPADDLVGHAMLQQGLRTPLALGQSLSCLARAEQALDLDSCRVAKIDLGRVGGLTPAIAIGRLLGDARIPCGVASEARGPIETLSALALAASADFALPAVCDWPPPADWFAATLSEPMRQQGRLIWELSAATGTGMAPDERRLAAVAIESATIG